MDYTKWNNIGAQYLTRDEMQWFQNGVRESFKAFLCAFPMAYVKGFKMAGCEVTGNDADGYTVQPGYIAIGGEFFRVDGNFIPGPVNPADSQYFQVYEEADAAGDGQVGSNPIYHRFIKRRARLVTGAINPMNPPMGKNAPYFISRLLEQFTLRIPTGDWNMTSGTNIAVDHGMPDYTKVRQIRCWVKPDDPDDTTLYNLEAAGIIEAINNTSVALRRADGGLFTTGAFFSTGFDRGYIDITFAP